MVKYSIVIPTYNHCDDLLKPCLDSIIKHTDFRNVEIIVVANGCVDNTKDFVQNLNHSSIKMIWNTEPLGYTTATNIGIRNSVGEYVILMNNDVVLLDYQSKNDWLYLLEQPFKYNKKVGMTGTIELYDPDVDSKFIVFCLVMIKKDLFNKFGLLDEIFSPGYGEDIDFNMKIKKAGYECVEVFDQIDKFGQYYSFPFWHKGSQTFNNIPSYTNEVVPRNKSILKERYSV